MGDAAEAEEDGPHRPWAQAFDLILSEYPGYTDDKILDLPLARVRQMVDVILDRKIRENKNQLRSQLKIAEVHVRTLGQLLSGIAGSKKAAKSIQAATGKISFDFKDEEKEKELPSTSAVMAMMGVRPDGQIGVR